MRHTVRFSSGYENWSPAVDQTMDIRLRAAITTPVSMEDHVESRGRARRLPRRGGPLGRALAAMREAGIRLLETGPG
jgi:hypothetical protein